MGSYEFSVTIYDALTSEFFTQTVTVVIKKGENSEETQVAIEETTVEVELVSSIDFEAELLRQKALEEQLRLEALAN